MAAFAPCSSSARPGRPGWLAWVAPLALALAAGGCVEELDPVEGTTSLRVELLEPTDPGSEDERLADDARSVKVAITALDAQNQVDTGFSGTVDLYAHFLGSLTPELGDDPLVSATLSGGEAKQVSVELPVVYGPSFLWAEHVSGDSPTYATGTSPTLWYRDPYLADVSRPPDEMGLGALERSPLELKQVSVTQSRHGARGRLVVTGVYAQGYTLSDVQCADADGTPPCTTGDYDHIYVFTFSRPEDEGHRPIERGQLISRVGGSVSEFNGLTELSFPQSFVVDAEPRPELLPEPVLIESDWLSSRIELERAEAALVAMEGATVCPLDDDYVTYSQWKLDVGRGCDNAINVISKGEATEFDPALHEGEVITRVVGTLRPVNIGSFHVWIVYPRDMGDIQL